MKIKIGALPGAALVAFAVFALACIWNVDNSYGTSCGSWIAPNKSNAEYEDAKTSSDRAGTALGYAILGDTSGLVGGTTVTWQADACDDARGGRTPVVALSGLVAAGLVVAAVLVRQRKPDAPRPAHPAS